MLRGREATIDGAIGRRSRVGERMLKERARTVRPSKSFVGVEGGCGVAVALEGGSGDR